MIRLHVHGSGDFRRLLQAKRLLIFDFDGTVADTSPLHERAFQQVLEPLGIKVNYADIAGLSTGDAIRRCLARTAVRLEASEIERLVAAKQATAHALIQRSLLPIPAVHAFLTAVRPHYCLAMVTSGSRKSVTLALEKLGYAGWFEPLLCAEDVNRGKPDPEGFLKALELADIPAAAAIVFEDSAAGVAAAAKAGIAVIDVRNTPFSTLTASRI